MNDLALAGDRVVALSPHGGLRVVDLAEPEAPVELGTLPILAELRDADAEGDLGAVVFGESRRPAKSTAGHFLATFDLSDPIAPRELGRLAMDAAAHRVLQAPGRAYVLADGQLMIADLSEPASPRWLGRLEHEGRLGDIAVRGAEAWLAAERRLDNGRPSGGFLDHVDISDPNDPRLLDRIELQAQPVGLAVAGHHVYVAEMPVADRATAPGIRVLDHTASPGGPGMREVGFLPLTASPSAVEAGGDRLYVTDSHLRVFDLSSPAHPRPRGSLLLEWPDTGFSRITVDFDRLYLSDGRHEAGVLVVDVSDPDAPRFIDRIIGLPGHPTAVAIAGEGLLVSLQEAGLALLRRP